MATDTTRLPVISNLQISRTSGAESSQSAPTKREEGKSSRDAAKLGKAASFLASFGLGSVSANKQPRPGDVYKPLRATSAAQPRPLGLIPDRGRIDALKELTKLLSPLPASAPVGTYRGSERKAVIGERGCETTEKTVQNGRVDEEELQEVISAEVTRSLREPKGSSKDADSPLLPFRLSATFQIYHSRPQHVETLEAIAKEPALDDHEYVDTLAKCNIQEYGISDPRPSRSLRMEASGLRKRTKTLPTASTELQPIPLSLDRNTGGPRIRASSSNAEYLSFTGQAQLWRRHLYTDLRDAMGYIPCERCRLRGGRCMRCMALRTGGGYIILDGTELPEDDGLGRHSRRGYRFGEWSYTGRGEGGEERKRRRKRRPRSDTDDGLTGLEGSEERGDGEEVRGGGGRETQSRGLGHGRDWGGGEGVDRGGGGESEGRGRRGTTEDTGQSSHRRSTGGAGMGERNEDGRRMYGGDSPTGRDRRSERGGGGMGGEGDDLEGLESGRQSSISRPASRIGSRPGSRLGSRPSSSLRRMGRGVERRERQRKNLDHERDRGDRIKGRPDGGESDNEEGSGDEGRRRRRRRRRKGEGEEGEGRDKLRDVGTGDLGKFRYEREEEEEEEEEGPILGNLIRFRSKRNDVKALQCTLKELQGIDPLDYLAKYCIIDQEKLPKYRRVYDNVDRDEDDEIDIMELDFALKAVNYNLISDAEMHYVHSVLELAGRYKLNFRLFSLVAALSEKVVALEDMVKRLINTMDFEALEVKMKKCKELFYLLADAQSSEHGGVVTTDSLAVELQAGGLTSEHVEFVVERLNHEGRGIVEFLDYLTYVPLFVEIHDSIYGNPLDFSRTK